MKRIILIFLVSMALLAQVGFCAEADSFMDIRAKILEESGKIQLLIGKTKDPVLVSSMFDACVITLTQIDAYFSIVGIFNTIPKEKLTKASVDYLANWLNYIKNTTDINVKNLESASKIEEAKTRVSKDRLKKNFINLNSQVAQELIRIADLRNSLEV